MATGNPFEFGRVLAAEDLVDRAEELAELRGVLAEARKHFLIGPRRFGKSSLLRAAAERATTAGVLVLPYTVERFPGLEHLAGRLVADAAAGLGGPLERAVAAARRLFRALRPEFSVDPATGQWSASLGIRAGGEPLPLLVEALDGVERLAQESGRPAAVVLDEFQYALERDGIAAERQIRAAVQQHRHVGYVFAGSDTRLLTAMVGEAQRPFYRLGSRRFLGPVPRPAFAAFLVNGLRPVAAAEDDGVEAIFELAEDVPYHVQLLAHGCWERARESTRKVRVDRPFVEAVNREAALRNTPVYAESWSSLAATQRRALLALLYESGGLMSSRVAQRFGVPVASMQKAIRALETKRVIRTEFVGSERRLRLEDPLFGTWVRESIPVPA